NPNQIQGLKRRHLRTLNHARGRSHTLDCLLKKRKASTALFRTIGRNDLEAIPRKSRRFSTWRRAKIQSLKSPLAQPLANFFVVFGNQSLAGDVCIKERALFEARTFNNGSALGYPEGSRNRARFGCPASRLFGTNPNRRTLKARLSVGTAPIQSVLRDD